MWSSEYLDENFNVRDNVFAVVTGMGRSGIHLRLENGQRAFAYFGYIPDIVQTDNGREFTNAKEDKKVHALDELLGRLRVKHQRIRPHTPRLNGKVERSHRTDGECFYKTLTFETLAELREKMQAWNERYNNRPHSSLRDKNGKRVWQTPLKKRRELMTVLQAPGEDTPKVRLIKRKTG